MDFQFDTKTRNIESTVNQNCRTISPLDVSRNGLDFKKAIGPSDIVTCTPGSTVSGSKIGTNDLLPACHSICARKSESMLESFTITTEHIRLIKYIQSLSWCTSQAGAIILIMNSNWGLRLCLPVQPVFAHLAWHLCPLALCVLSRKRRWACQKNMLVCSGAEILSKILYYLRLARWPRQPFRVVLPFHSWCLGWARHYWLDPSKIASYYTRITRQSRPSWAFCRDSMADLRGPKIRCARGRCGCIASYGPWRLARGIFGPANLEGFGYSAVEVILYCTDTMIEVSSDFTLPLPGVFRSINFSNLPFRVVGQ